MKFLLFVSLMISVIAMLSHGQTNTPQIILPLAPGSAVAILPPDGPEWQNFKDTVKDPDGRIVRASFIVSNLSSKAIMAMAISYEVTNSLGQARTKVYFCDSYLLLDPRASVPGSSRVLVAPLAIVRPGQRAPARIRYSLLEDASQVKIRVDSVIYEDGEVVGPDFFKFDDTIAARYEAAKTLAGSIHQARQRGESSTDLVSRIAHGAPLESDKREVWKQRFAQSILKEAHKDSFLRYLEGLPAPPKFHRP